MNKKLTATNIIQAPKSGSVVFTEVDDKGNQVAGGVRVAVQFPDPKDAAKFEQGANYNVDISPAG